MNIQYMVPLTNGFGRMRKALFPIDLKKWFVVGFTAFLAGLTDWHGGTGGKSSHNVNWEDVIYFPQRAWEWLAENPVWVSLIAVAAVVLVILGILCVWWSSRGKFMYLDNVVHDRAQVVVPWREYRTEGNSLFLWSLALGAASVAVVIWYVVRCIIKIQTLYEAAGNMGSLISPIIMMALGLFAILLVAGFLHRLLYDFVVPIMYRDRISTSDAVRKFYPLFLSQFVYFVGYALFMLLILLAVAVCIAIFGLLTCCIGFLILAIPYINAVLLLPISYTLRAFSVEFLEQFGPEYHVFPRPESTSSSTGATKV